ncbi:MAG: HAD family hydrolase [Anaeromyxobacteraceae bacterium]
MTSRFAVILLDIDGTLIHAAGAGRRSINRALVEHCRTATATAEAALTALRLDGMTDRLIVREGMKLLGHPFDDAACDAVLARYVAHLERELAAAPDAAARHGFSVLPGVEALLAALAGRRRPYGLCTGNVLEGARHKLARGRLDRWFEWHPEAIGGFAHDGEERRRVVEAAVRRASARLGRAVAPAECLVVGDTPRDVEAAHAAGCPALAVATGNYTVEALAATGADRVVPTLEHPDAQTWLLG